MTTSSTFPPLYASTFQYIGAVITLLLNHPESMPPDWRPEATTYDLPRHFSESVFVENFKQTAETIYNAQITDPLELRQRMESCGLPYDYARLGQPLSTLYELCLQVISGVDKAVSFASVTKPFLSVIEARQDQSQPVILACGETLPLSSAYKQMLSTQNVRIFEQASFDALEVEESDALRIWVNTTPPTLQRLEALKECAVDAVTYPLEEGGVLMIKSSQWIDPHRIQVIRKRTVSALLPANCENELRRLLNLAVQPAADQDLKTVCAEQLHQIFPALQPGHTAFFCTGLAAEAAVFQAAAQTFDVNAPIPFYYAQNGYGGTGQLIGEILPQHGQIQPMPLTVIDPQSEDQSTTFVDRFLAQLEQHKGEPVLVFLETPTNPQLQMHDFAQLVAGLKDYQAKYKITLPVIVDTTMAPLYPLFEQDFAQDWPFLLVKSGSKYFTKGKATLGVVMTNAHELSLQILERTHHLGQDADSFAKHSQLQALSAGLSDLPERMAQIAENTRQIVAYMKVEMARRELPLTLYEMTPEQIQEGLSTGIISFYLPPASLPDGVDLVDYFVDYMLQHAPEQVKNRVSYGQSGGSILQGVAQDYIYIINPEESTQGALSQEVKDAQKKDNVQICRISVPAHCNVTAFTAVLGSFFDTVY